MNGTGTKAGLHAIAGETRDHYRWIALGVTSAFDEATVTSQVAA